MSEKTNRNELLEIISRLMSDGVPRTGREIAILLTAHGLNVPKRTVNSVLYREGQDCFQYDRDSNLYTFDVNCLQTAVNGFTSQEDAIVELAEPPVMTEDADIGQSSIALSEGMIVRVPFDVDDRDAIAGDYREYRAGHVVSIDSENRQVVVHFLHVDSGHEYREKRTVDATDIDRCFLPDQIRIQLKSRSGKYSLLTSVKSEFDRGLMKYFVQVGDTIKVISEADILFNSHLQAPDPRNQLIKYELHNPVWLTNRNQILESYRALQNATFGIEALVGTRVQLLAHQAEVIAEVLSNNRCRYVLADEVGLGKTIEACVILKSLKHREKVNTLIVVPNSLIRQWYNELDNKFWLAFQVIDTPNKKSVGKGDTIISAEALAASGPLQMWVRMQNWDLLVVDEAHRARLNDELYDTLITLSELTTHVLLLSATPIQREALEYIALLKLLDPVQYDRLDANVFSSMLNAQQRIREVVAYLAQDLVPDRFDVEDFKDEIQVVVSDLNHDETLRHLVEAVQSNEDLDKAKDVIAYISKNYRIESQIIRNRRKTLQARDQIVLPERRFSMEYAYEPAENEQRILESLHGYTDLFQGDRRALPFLQDLWSAAASSPHALSTLLNTRKSTLKASLEAQGNAKTADDGALYHPEEETIIRELSWFTERWQTETDEVLSHLPATIAHEIPHRLGQVIRAIDQLVRREKKKVVVFSARHPTLKQLKRTFDLRYGSSRIAQFLVTMSAEELQEQVDRFQSQEECLILLTDESGGEGRNFQIADSIVHVDVPWMPATIEQRIGRVDRIGREGIVTSIVPFAIDTLESELVALWQDAFKLFSESLSGLEIVLESIQDRVAQSFLQDSRVGLANLRDEMIEQAARLRHTVEEERYYEENAGNLAWSRDLRDLLARYNDGDLLREPILKWASLAGLNHHYNPQTRIAQIGRNDFNIKSIQNAKFVNPPNMNIALERSKRRNRQILAGTFDRGIAVRREDIIFFAPGEPWTDTILQNAILSDRGRSCGILRIAEGLSETWYGFEYIFSCKVNPRPLYKAGLLPVYLFKAGEFFMTLPTHRVLVSIDGEVMSYSSNEARITRKRFNRQDDKHLGKRGGTNPLLQQLKGHFTSEQWRAGIERSFNAALHHLHDDYNELIDEDVEHARQELDQRIRGQIAALAWLPKERQPHRAEEIELMKRVNAALLEGMESAEWKLESACFWMLEPAHED